LEIVEREGLGRLVPPADADALARAVVELLADDEARAEMADRARRVAMERFGWDRAAERTIEILQEVARPR
jgi:glycosyltransferase involved in cell wall biosynthesis